MIGFSKVPALVAAAAGFAVFGVAGLLSMTAPASAKVNVFSYARDTGINCLHDHPAWPQDKCFALVINGGSGQDCLSRGGWITVGGRKEFYTACYSDRAHFEWQVNFHPTHDDNRTAVECLKHGESAGFRNGRITCMATPEGIFDRWGNLLAETSYRASEKDLRRIGDGPHRECRDCQNPSNKQLPHGAGPSYSSNPLPVQGDSHHEHGAGFVDPGNPNSDNHHEH